MFLKRNLGGNNPQIKYLDIFYTDPIVVGFDVIAQTMDSTCILFGIVGGNIVTKAPKDWEDTVVGFYAKN